MERLRGKLKGDTASKITAAEKRNHGKALRANMAIESRSIEILIREFHSSAGDFDTFHSSMNGREKLLFKEYLRSMRDAAI